MILNQILSKRKLTVFQEQMMKKQHMKLSNREYKNKQLKIPSGHMEGLSIDQQMKISRDYNRKSPEEKLTQTRRAWYY